MKSITTNLRTHVLVLKDGQEFHITSDQYSLYSKAHNEAIKEKNYDKPFYVKDCDTGEILCHERYGNIDKFRIKKSSNGTRNFYCDFGELHPIAGSCDCREKTGLFPFEFKDKARELFQIRYVQDLTEGQKNEIYKQLRSS